MKDHRLYLKVKIKSLAAEAAIIRFETARAPKEIRNGLSLHRRTVVREAARNTLIAYGFIRGRTYRQMEATNGAPPDWKAVAKMVDMYGLQRNYPTIGTYAEYEVAKKAEAERLKAWQVEPPLTQANEYRPIKTRA